MNGVLSMIKKPYTQSARASTTNAVQTTIHTIPTNSNCSYILIADCVGTKDDGSIVLAGRIVNSFNNDGGTLTRKSSLDTNAYMYKAASGYTFVSAVSGTNILLKVKGATGTNITWNVEYHIFSQGA